MKIFNLFIKNKNISLDDRYRYWRIRIFYSMYIGYISYYLTRSSFKILDVFLISEGLLTKEKHGIILAAFGISYALSKFVAGILTDLTKPKILISIGILFSGIANLAMTQGNSFYFFLTIWILNGLFQGLGWPPIAKMLTKWYSKKERGRWWGFWSTSHNVGDFLSPIIMSIAICFSNWRIGMAISGIIAIFMSMILINRLKSSPTEVNLPEIGIYKKDSSDIENIETKTLPFKTLLLKYVFTNPNIWSLILASISISVIRSSISPWIIHFFIDKGYDKLLSISMISAFELGGLFGSFLSGWISDRIFKGKRSVTCILFCLGIVLSSIILWKSPFNYYTFDYFICALIGFFVYGPHMLLGVSISETASKEAVSTATGFASLWAYLGTAVTHILIPRIGWKTYFMIIISNGLIATISFLPLFKTDYFKRRS